MKLIALAATLALSSLFFAACSQVENAIDCNGICDRYQTCFDDKYDTSACQARCRDDANSDADSMARTSACASCIDDESCVSATFKCGTECAGIVP